jgi:hypothetical protein
MAEHNKDRPVGFLGRWARRKNDALQGKPLDEPAPAKPATQAPLAASGAVAAAPASAGASPESTGEDAPNPLTLDDVKVLTKDSDFKPFMGRGVEPGVRNAAMKKLFEDPHFNVMDRLDIYIDDYSIPDPLPLSMLRQMASAKFLNLFEEEEDKDKTPALAADQARESDNGPVADSVAHSAQETQAALPDIDQPDSPLPGFVPEGTRQENHAHTDLRLQPNHPAQEPGAGRSPE